MRNLDQKNNLILYSFRRCPYAMRSRMSLYKAGLIVELREIELKNKYDVILLLEVIEHINDWQSLIKKIKKGDILKYHYFGRNPNVCQCKRN